MCTEQNTSAGQYTFNVVCLCLNNAHHISFTATFLTNGNSHAIVTTKISLIRQSTPQAWSKYAPPVTKSTQTPLKADAHSPAAVLTAVSHRPTINRKRATVNRVTYATNRTSPCRKHHRRIIIITTITAIIMRTVVIILAVCDVIPDRAHRSRRVVNFRRTDTASIRATSAKASLRPHKWNGCPPVRST